VGAPALATLLESAETDPSLLLVPHGILHAVPGRGAAAREQIALQGGGAVRDWAGFVLVGAGRPF
jgi:hypothetical protein